MTSTHIALVQGDILESKFQVLTVPVNAVGVAGKGLALTFKHKYPEWFKHYVRWCSDGCNPFGASFDGYKPKIIYPATTKHHWRDKSTTAMVTYTLGIMLATAHSEHWESVAIPALGCGLGGLHWNVIIPMMCICLKDMPCPVEIYLPI